MEGPADPVSNNGPQDEFGPPNSTRGMACDGRGMDTGYRP